MGQAYTNKENDISEDSYSCFFFQYPNNSEENNESCELGLLNTRCEYWRQCISTTTMYEWIVDGHSWKHSPIQSPRRVHCKKKNQVKTYKFKAWENLSNECQ